MSCNNRLQVETETAAHRGFPAAEARSQRERATVADALAVADRHRALAALRTDADRDPALARIAVGRVHRHVGHRAAHRADLVDAAVGLREAAVNLLLVLGEGVVATEEEFRAKIASELNNQFKPNADHLFIHTAKDIIIEKMKDVQFPDAFLKRWLLESNDKKTAEEVEADYPAILEDLKFHIAKQKIVEEGGIKVEYQDIEALAAEVAKAQFAQYGMTNLPADVLQNYTKSLLEKEETIQNLYDRATEEKIIAWLKDNLAVTEKEISSKEFSELMSEHAHQHGEHTGNHAEEGDNEEGSAAANESSAE